MKVVNNRIAKELLKIAKNRKTSLATIIKLYNRFLSNENFEEANNSTKTIIEDFKNNKYLSKGKLG